jgi:geranylgeranyl pyrophosphate synthase
MVDGSKSHHESRSHHSERTFADTAAETAGLFRMLARMLDAKSDSPTKLDVTLLTRFMTLLGRLFQIRDDYMNLTSADVSPLKLINEVQ